MGSVATMITQYFTRFADFAASCMILILPEEGVRLIAGDYIALASTNKKYENALPVEYDNLHKEVNIGERILLADGMLELCVTSIEEEKVICKVITGGVVYTKKGVNMPQTDLHVPAFSEKDRIDLQMALEEKLDFVALSFVRSAKDLEEIKSIIDKSEHKPLLIAKIEKPQAELQILNLSLIQILHPEHPI